MTIDTKAIFAEVKANMAKLDACPRHEFVRLESSILSKYKCTKCGGKIDNHAFHWYKTGIEHASR